MTGAFLCSEIEKKLGYVFKDKELLKEAFTHSTYAHLYGGKSNERMEYLGDSVLQLVVTEWQYKSDEKASEGTLTARRQKIVCKDALESAVDSLGIWEYLLSAGRKVENVGEKAKSSLFEAVTAAIYLDGGYEAVKTFLLQHGNLRFDSKQGNPVGDLKEYLEKRGEKEARETWEKSGKDNSPVFHCVLSALGASARGEGKNKREARATAAARLLWELTGKDKHSAEKKRKK